MVGFWHGCKSGTQNVLNETLVFVVNEVRDIFHNLECHKIIYCHWDGITLSATGRLLWNPQCGWPIFTGKQPLLWIYYQSSLRTSLSVLKLKGRTLQGVVGDDRGKPIEPKDWENVK